MTQAPAPATSRRRLGHRLRQIREARSQSYDDVRKAMDWSLSKTVRIKRGEVSISTGDLHNLLAFYGIADLAVTTEMVDLARRPRRRLWTSAYRNHASPAFLDFLAYEGDAVSVKSLHPLVIPALLQTEPYTRHLLSSVGSFATSEVEVRVGLRLTRQERFFGAMNASQVVAVLDEASSQPTFPTLLFWTTRRAAAASSTAATWTSTARRSRSCPSARRRSTRRSALWPITVIASTDFGKTPTWVLLIWPKPFDIRR